MAWNPKADPIVGGNTATGERYTKSGLVISSSGNVVQGKTAPKTVQRPGDYGKTQGGATSAGAQAASGRESARSRSVVAGKTKPMGQSDYREMQKILSEAGYAIGNVDGKWGPRSKAAWTNYKSARKNGLDVENAAAYWSEHSRYSKGFKPPKTRTDGKPTVTGNPGVTGTAGTSTATPTTGSPYASMLADLMAQFGQTNDPAKLAEAASNAEYGGQLAGLTKEMQDSSGRAKQAQLDIGKWFNEALASVRGGADADQAASASVLAGQDVATNNIMGSLNDDSLKYALGKTAAYNRSNLAGIGAIEGQTDRNVMDSIVMRGAEERLGRARQDDAYRKDLVAKMSALLGEKGSKENLYRSQYQNEALQRKAGLADMIGMFSILPAQLDQAQLGNESAYLNNRYTEAKIASTIAGMQSSGGEFSNSERRQVANDMYEAAAGYFDPNDDGDMSDGVKPNQVVSYLNGILNQNGIAPLSSLGISLRAGALKRFGIRVGPKGNPIGIVKR